MRIAVVVLGVSGSGKTTVGTLLAERLGAPFVDGDSLHSKQNLTKMAAGMPLTDTDRLPWLRAIAARIAESRRTGEPVVLACSGLKRRYRDLLRDGHDDVALVLLDCSRDELERRLSGRKGHFFPAGLLDSQLATLEPPGPDEPVLTVDGDQSPEVIVAELVRRFG